MSLACRHDTHDENFVVGLVNEPASDMAGYCRGGT